MNREFLKELGLDDVAIGKIMDENGKDVEREKRTARELKEKLGKYDGVDLDTLQKEANSAKETLAKRDFEDLLKGKISALHGKNAKSIMAILDVDALKNSQNRDADIETALNGLKESDPYLFGEEKQPVAKVSTAASHEEESAKPSGNEFMNKLIRGEINND